MHLDLDEIEMFFFIPGFPLRAQGSIGFGCLADSGGRWKVYWDIKLTELNSIVVFDYIIDMNCKAV